MPDRIIPIYPYTAAPLLHTDHPEPQVIVADSSTLSTYTLLDSLQRPCHDLRISVTDRCNFRCVYCMPRNIFDQNYPYLPHKSLLTFEEITRTSQLFIALGVKKIRLTGGEPLLRKNLHHLISMLRQISMPGETILDLALTTNGALLTHKAQQLKDAGLNRVTVSLDALDETLFKQMNDADFSVNDVLRGIDAAHQAGLGPIKINMVVKAGMNDSQIIPMARYFKNSPFVLRFIEYMDVGSSNGWKMNDVIPSQTIIDLIDMSSTDMKLTPIESHSNSETAQRWKYQDGTGEIGVISSVTQAFCHECTRIRLSTEGKLYTCLFASEGQDIRHFLRNGTDDKQILAFLTQLWATRNDRYSELRGKQAPNPHKIEMSYIGG